MGKKAVNFLIYFAYKFFHFFFPWNTGMLADVVNICSFLSYASFPYLQRNIFCMYFGGENFTKYTCSHE